MKATQAAWAKNLSFIAFESKQNSLGLEGEQEQRAGFPGGAFGAGNVGMWAVFPGKGCFGSMQFHDFNDGK